MAFEINRLGGEKLRFANVRPSEHEPTSFHNETERERIERVRIGRKEKKNRTGDGKRKSSSPFYLIAFRISPFSRLSEGFIASLTGLSPRTAELAINCLHQTHRLRHRERGAKKTVSPQMEAACSSSKCSQLW